MNSKTIPQSRDIAEMCADLVDVLGDTVDQDALHTLLLICFDISGLRRGATFTVDSLHQIDESIELVDGIATNTKVSLDQTPAVALRAMQTLQSEFAVTSDLTNLQYEYAFPLRVRGQALGAVVLYSSETKLLDEEVISSLQSIADIAASTIDQTHQVRQTRTLATQLQTALNSRIVLEQAKGILAERYKIDCGSAFSELRKIARREQRPIHHVAADIISLLNTTPDSHSASPRTSVA